MVIHSKGEYVRPTHFHTNAAEGFFAILRRGIMGVYHHVSEARLKRYVTEFDFRYNTRKLTDFERATEALKGIAGKRLTYRRIGQVAARQGEAQAPSWGEAQEVGALVIPKAEHTKTRL